MLSARQQLLALAMAAVGTLAWWLQQDDERPVQVESQGEHRPDYSVDNFTAVTMDESGMPDRRLAAVELRHYPDDDSKELESPRLTLFEDSGPPWVLRSESAWISGDDNLIRLHGEVYIDREGGETTQAAHLRASEVLMKRDQRYAETDRPVRITTETDWMTSEKGAEIWLEEKLRVNLLGRVRGEKVIPSP